MELVFRADAGHGWLQVPMSLVRDLGILDDITPYSYRRGDTAYLEEDCDASLLINALRDAGVEVTCREVNDGDESIIRRYQRFYKE